MSPDAERIAILEARIAELEQSHSRPMRPTRRLAILVLAAALLMPAGVVLANHQFSDVPTSHQFHNAIDAIADAGITTGCGGGNYCPNGLVTRGQMAAFLSRLGALQPGSPPKVNADKVDGFDAVPLLLGTAFIPPGRTVTGAEWHRTPVVADKGNFTLTVLFPAPARHDLTFDTVNFAPHVAATDDDPTCTGTPAAPTAPPGKVCIYLDSVSSAAGFQGIPIALDGFFNRGFLIDAVANGPAGSGMSVLFSWAYTAP